MKKRIGIDIDEIIRGRWMAFDNNYKFEFDCDDLDVKHTLNLFEDYPFKDTEETVNILKDDAPVDLDAKDYLPDEKNIAKADDLLFDVEVLKKTAKENFEEFTYVDYVFEIFGSCDRYNNKLIESDLYSIVKNNIDYDIILYSKNDYRTIQPTLFFLSKIRMPIRKFEFYNNDDEIIESFDVIISTDDKLIDMIGDDKKLFLIEREYNKNVEYNNKFSSLKDIVDENGKIKGLI